MTEEQLKDANETLNLIGLENVQDIIFIKHGATNGETLKAAFNVTDTIEDFNMQTMSVTMNNTRKTFGRDWWYETNEKAR